MNSNAKNPLHWFILALVLIVLFMSWQFLKSINKKQIVNTTAQGKEAEERRGYLKISARNNLKEYAVGQPIVIEITADSDGEDVVGYDIVFAYLQEAFSLNSTQSQLTGFNVVTNDGDGLVITAAQGPNSNQRNILKDSKILTLTFTPKFQGEYTFQIFSKTEFATTKFVNTKIEEIFPETNSLDIEVR